MCTYFGPPGTVQPADLVPSHYTPAQAQLVLGGEVSMWGDDVNADIIEAFVWRGAAALAERLWSEPSALRNPRHNNAPTVRLAQHSCRMRMRGMAVGPTQAGWCPADSLPPSPPSRDQQQNELSVLRREVARLRKENAALRQSRPLKLDDNPRMRDYKVRRAAFLAFRPLRTCLFTAVDNGTGHRRAASGASLCVCSLQPPGCVQHLPGLS